VVVHIESRCVRPQETHWNRHTPQERLSTLDATRHTTDATRDGRCTTRLHDRAPRLAIPHRAGLGPDLRDDVDMTTFGRLLGHAPVRRGEPGGDGCVVRGAPG
jgi:hypothetical protein